MHEILKRLVFLFSQALLCKPEEIDINRPYVEMGVDSILANQLVQLIREEFNILVTSADLFNWITIRDIEKHINQVSESEIQQLSPMNSEEDFINNEKIAIIGIAGHFPEAQNVEKFWDLILRGKCVTQGMSLEREWTKEAAYNGAFLKEIKKFDAEFFSISPKEALLMDPQHRLLLEVSYQAFENAGLSLEQLDNSSCAVVATSLPGDYRYLIQNTKDAYSSFSFLGNAASALSGRISHFFNLKGPSITLDTACSSSLVALQVASDALKNHNCKIALVGATSVFSTPEIFNLAEASSISSKDKLCKPFDVAANGFIPAEAVACIVLKRLSDAVKDKDHIYGVIEGLNINHDGRTNGLMSPNSGSQAELIKNTYKQANISVAQIGYIEAHGTGTEIGDAIEIKALERVFQDSNIDQPIPIGSLKANIGHTLVASGLLSTIKILKILETEIIPPQINYHIPNLSLNLQKFVISSAQDTLSKDKNLVCVSSFGFAGTNGHLVISPYLRHPDLSNEEISKFLLFIFSSHTEKSLIKNLTSLLEFFKGSKTICLEDLSYTLLCRRSFLSNVIAFIADSLEDLINQLEGYLRTKKKPSFVDVHLDLTSQEIIEKSKSVTDNDKLKTFMSALFVRILNKELVNVSALYSSSASVQLLPPYEFDSKEYWIHEELIPIENKSFFEEDQISEKNNIILLIKRTLSKLLGYDISLISEEKSLHNLGCDSLVVLQIIEGLGKRFGNISPNELFNQENLKNLAEYLIKKKEKESSSTLFKEVEDPLRAEIKLFNQRGIHHNSLEWHIFGKEGGKPLLLLSPLNTLSHVWIQQIRYFMMGNYEIFIPHYPGHGQSTFEQHTIIELGKKIFEDYLSIQKSNSEKCDVVGWSLGGCLSLVISYHYQNYLNKVCVINTASFFDNDIFSQTMTLRDELEGYSQYLSFLFDGPKKNIVDYITAFCSLDILKHYYTELQNFDFRKYLPQIQMEILIFYGKKDTVIKIEDIYRLKEIKKNHIEIFEKDGHFLPLFSSFTMNKKLERFLIS